MAKGASSRSGPAPDPNALRRERDSGDWLTLDAAGRQDPPPDWPLEDAVARLEARLAEIESDPDPGDADYRREIRQTRLDLQQARATHNREAHLWADLWTRPQATQWERNNQQLEVALFVRSFVDAEQPGATKAMRDLVRMGLEALGLSIPGLQRNHWKIGEATADPAASSARVSRGGLRLVGAEAS